jgi:hypothetical protein
LAIEIILLMVLGIGSIALWTGWKMQQILIESHRQNIEYIATYIPHTVEVYSSTNHSRRFQSRYDDLGQATGWQYGGTIGNVGCLFPGCCRIAC